MIKYPFIITIDTNIFDACKYNFSENGNLARLKRYVDAGKISVSLSDVVLGEMNSHIKSNALEIASEANRFRKKLFKSFSQNTIEDLLPYEIPKLNSTELAKNAQSKLQDYLIGLNYEKMDSKTVDLKSILSDYFECRPPFESKETKKSEFPDAIIAAQIKNRFCNEKQFGIVTNDNGLEKAVRDVPGAILYRSLPEMFDALNKEETLYKDAFNRIEELRPTICSILKKYIELNDCVDIAGVSYDKDGITEGYDYTDTDIVNIDDVDFKIFTIDEVNDSIIYTTLDCTSNIEAICYYEDYDNAAWDSEEETYIYVETRVNQEKHRARFPVGLEINRLTRDLKFSNFLVLLGQSTLQSRTEIELE